MFNLWDYTTLNFFLTQISPQSKNICTVHIPVFKSAKFQKLAGHIYRVSLRPKNLNLFHKLWTEENWDNGKWLLNNSMSTEWGSWTTFQARSGLRFQGLAHHTAHSNSKAEGPRSRPTQGTAQESSSGLNRAPISRTVPQISHHVHHKKLVGWLSGYAVKLCSSYL